MVCKEYKNKNNKNIEENKNYVRKDSNKSKEVAKTFKRKTKFKKIK